MALSQTGNLLWHRSKWVLAVSFCLAYFASAWLGEYLSFKPSAFVTTWAPSGVFLATLLLTDPRNWWIFVVAAIPANLSFDLLHNRPLALSLIFTLGNCLEPLVGAWLVRYFVLKQERKSYISMIIILVACGAMLSTTLSAFIGSWAVSHFFGGDYWSTWRVWWAADALGVLIFTPPILAAARLFPLGYRSEGRQSNPYKIIEGLILFTLIFICAVLVSILPNPAVFQFEYLVFPFLIWAAMRFGLLGASMGALLISLVAVFLTTHGIGQFALSGSPIEDQAQALQVYAGAASFTALALAGAMLDRHTAVEDLQKSEQRFRLLAENARDLLYRYRFLPSPVLEYISPSCTAITGYPPETYYADPQLLFKQAHPDDRHLYEEIHDPSSDLSKPLTMRWMRQNGSLTWVEQMIVPTRASDGRLEVIEVTARDILERVRFQAERISNEGLATTNALASGIVHEMNTPLQVITGSSDSLIRHLDNNDLNLEKARGYLQNISTCAWRLAEIVHSLSIYTEMSENGRKPCDLNAVVTDTLLLVQHQLKTWHDIELVSQLDETLPSIDCDRSKISKALVDLVYSARDTFKKPGWIKISTKYDAGAQRILLQVSDNGAGIPAEICAKIFEPFYATRAAENGMGLGLVRVMNMVNEIGGNVKLESEIGMGTTVSLTIPTSGNSKAAVL